MIKNEMRTNNTVREKLDGNGKGIYFRQSLSLFTPRRLAARSSIFRNRSTRILHDTASNIDARNAYLAEEP